MLQIIALILHRNSFLGLLKWLISQSMYNIMVASGGLRWCLSSDLHVTEYVSWIVSPTDFSLWPLKHLKLAIIRDGKVIVRATLQLEVFCRLDGPVGAWYFRFLTNWSDSKHRYLLPLLRETALEALYFPHSHGLAAQ